VVETHRRDLLADLKEVVSFREALAELVKRDLKVRYKRSVLGLAWTMVHPLLMMAVTTVVFSSLFRFAIDRFPIYVLAGYVLWGFFAQATAAATTSILSGGGLIRRIYIPPVVFPLAAVLAAGVNLVLSLIPLALVVLLSGGQFNWALLSLPLALALAMLFTAGVALILATASVFFHDTIHIYQVLTMAWMYLTPIFYPVEIVPDEWAFIVWANPFYHLVQIFRDPIYAGLWPDPVNLAVAAGYAVGVAAFGWWYSERSRDAFAAYL